MKILYKKMKSRILFSGLPDINPNVFIFSFLLYFFAFSAFGADDVYRLNLNVGDALYYKLENRSIRDLYDTTISTSWVDIKVLNKEDSIYTVQFNHRRKITEAKNGAIDSRDGYFPYGRNFEHINEPFTLFISETGKVQPYTIPDSIIKKRIDECCRFEMHKAHSLITNYKIFGESLTPFLQSFFVDLQGLNKGKGSSQLGAETYKTSYAKTRSDDESMDFSFQSFLYNSDTSNTESLRDKPFQINRMKGVGSGEIDIRTGILNQMQSSTETTYTVKTPEIQKVNVSVQILAKRYFPRRTNKIVITGEVADNYDGNEIRCFVYNNYVEKDLLTFNSKLEPSKSFEIEKVLERPVALSLRLKHVEWALSNFLLEPGDSIHLNISKRGVEFSGDGALKNKVYTHIKSMSKGISKTESEAQAQENIQNQINEQLRYLEAYKDSISSWSYALLKADIFFGRQNALIFYYYHKNNKLVNKESFDLLFDKLDWDKYKSISSIEMRNFLDTYLYRKGLIMKGYKDNRNISDSETYYLAGLMFKDEVRYTAQAQATYNALKGNDTHEGNRLFKDFQEKYRDTYFYACLKKKYDTRINLGNGAKVPDFTVSDINGKKVTLSKYKGKYVQLLFVSLNLAQEVKDLAEYQLLKERLSEDKFEMITIFVNSEDSLTQNYLKQNNLKGVLVKNHAWENDQLKQFNMEAASSYFLINPEGVIVFSGSGSPNNEFVKMIIDMVNNDTYNKAEASISARILYWVLAGAVFLIVLSWIVMLLLSRRVKRREAQNREQLELKLGAVRSQLNPHFLFNSMSSIQYLVNHNENEKANQFLSKFAKLMRKILFQSEVEMVTLNEEIATIETYLELEALRHHFQFSISVDKRIDRFNTEIPVMLLQPFVENAVIHGISKKGVDGLITVNFELVSDERIRVVILDNGDGISKSSESTQLSNGKGIRLTQKRIDLMIDKYQNEIDFTIENRSETENGTRGTRVVISFEIEH